MPDPEYIYFGRVTDAGQIELPGKKMRQELRALSGFPIEVRVRRKRNRRSDRENRYYWGCIVASVLSAFREWSPDIGWTDEMVHAYLKSRFLPLVREWETMANPNTGEVIDVPLTTTKLTTIEAEDYYELCRQWAAEEMGIIIPMPNEQSELFYAAP